MAVVVSQLIGKVGLEGSEKTKADLQEIGKRTDETKEHFRGLKDALSMAAGFAIFGGVSAGFGFLKDQVTDVIKLTSEFEQTQAQTVQVLKSTHDVSGMTAEALDKLAEKYGKTTMFSADTVKGGENLLLTFTNIGKKVFPDATQAILDVSQAMGQDLKESAIQVGKALGDPTTGMMALQRIGVTFSASEKEQIKTMMAHNDIIGAQKVILHELATEFGGSATAAGQTFGGQMAILGHQFDDIKIKIGSALLPVLSDLLNKYIVPLATKFADWMTKGGGLQDFQKWLKQAVMIFETQFLPDLNQLLNKYIIPLATAFFNVGVQLVNFVGWLQKGGPAADTVKVALAGVGAVIAGFKVAGFLKDLNGGIGDAITNAGKMKTAFLDFVNWFKGDFLQGIGIGKQGIQDVGTASEVSSGEMAALGTTSETTAAEVTTAGIDSSVAGGEIATMGTEAGVASAGGIASFTSSLRGMLGPLAIIASISAWLLMNREQIAKDITVPPDKNGNGGSGVPGMPGFPGIPAMASGGSNLPGGTYLVGDRGPELMQVPAGSNIIPNSMIGSMSGGQQVIQVQVYLNDYQMAQQLMPAIVQNLRVGTGRLGM